MIYIMTNLVLLNYFKLLKLHNQKLARSLKKGCNDHIEELAIIKDKLVTSAVKQSSNKRAKTNPVTD